MNAFLQTSLNAMYLLAVGSLSSAALQIEIIQLFIMYIYIYIFNSSVTLLLLEKHCVHTLKPVQEDPIILQLHVKAI